jgi:hypothetical protein
MTTWDSSVNPKHDHLLQQKIEKQLPCVFVVIPTPMPTRCNLSSGQQTSSYQNKHCAKLVGFNASAQCKTDEEPGEGIEIVQLLLLGNNNHKGVNSCRDEGNCIIDKKSTYMFYSQVEVDKMGANGVVMDDEKDGKDQMIDVEMNKNG